MRKNDLALAIINNMRSGTQSSEIKIIQDEVSKLNDNQVYLEIGVERGKSLFAAYYAAKDGVTIVGIDIVDMTQRINFMEDHFLVTQFEPIIFIHGESSLVSKFWTGNIGVLFIDGDHSIGGVRKDTESWWPKVEENGVVLYHDWDAQNSPDVSKYIRSLFSDNEIGIYDSYNDNWKEDGKLVHVFMEGNKIARIVKSEETTKRILNNKK